MAKDLEALQEQIKQLRKEYQEIVGKPAALFDDTNIKNAKAAVDTLTKAIKEAENEVFKLEGGFEGLRKEINGISGEFSKQTNFAKDFTKLYSKVDTIAKSLQYNERGINELNSKQLKSYSSKLNRVKDEARFKAEALIKEKNIFDLNDKQFQVISQKMKDGTKLNAQEEKYFESRLNFGNKLDDQEKAILKAYIAQFPELDRILKKTKERYEEEKKLEKSLGVVGGILKGISKIPIIGDVVDAEEALEAMKDAGGGIKGLKAGLSNLKTQFIEGITNPSNLATGAIVQMYLALKSSDEATGKLAKDFNLTYDQAANVREELIQIGNLSGDVALNARALQESMIAVGQSLGTNAKLNTEDLKTFTLLREKAGLTNEELVPMQNLTSVIGGNLEDNYTNMLAAAKATGLNNKVLLNEKDIMRDVSKASNAVKLSVAGGAEGLAKAAAQAKALGMSLEQVDKIAESLLNFEQSITAELEAELLTGKELNLEQARLYALNNDMEGLSRELAKNFRSAAEFSKMNRLQQEAAAKAVGMSREELAKTLIDKEALQKMSEKDPELAKKTLEFARQKGMTDEEISKLKKGDFDNLMRQQSVQERLNNSVEKLKEIFISIAEPVLGILSPLMDILNLVLPGISAAFQVILTPISWLAAGIREIVGLFQGGELTLKGMAKLAVGLVGTFALYRAIMLGITAQKIAQKGLDITAATMGKGMLATLVAQAVAWTIMNPFKALIGLAVAGAVGSMIYSSIKGDDVMSEGGYGNRTLLTPKGSIALNDKDTVIAGTNLGQKRNENTTQQVAYQDLSPLLEELKALRQEQAKANAKPTVIENNINSTKFGTALATNVYKVQ